MHIKLTLTAEGATASGKSTTLRKLIKLIEDADWTDNLASSPVREIPSQTVPTESVTMVFDILSKD